MVVKFTEIENVGKGYECDLCSSVFSGVLETGAKRYENYNIKI